LNPDWDGRNFVGRFTSEPEAIETANGKWTIQGAMFEEVPTARMLVYPNDWANDGHPINVCDDFFPLGVPKPLVALMQGTWITQLNPKLAGPSAADPTAYECIDVTPAAGDWAQTQYTGWGFQMTFRLAATLGAIAIALDGVTLTTLDLSTGVATGSTGIVSVVVTGAAATVTVTNVPLDIHLLKVAYAGASTAGGVSIIYPALEYMY